MQANMPNNIIIGGFFSIQLILTTKNLHVISKLKLKKRKLLPPACLDKAYYFEANENKIRGWGAKS